MGEATGEVKYRTGLDRESELSDTARAISTTQPVAGVEEGAAQAARIRTGIQHTRAEMSETIDALQEKLDPARIKEQVKEQIREKATEAYDAAKSSVREATIGKAEKMMATMTGTVSDMTGRTGTSFAQYVRDNPLPFALLGAGIGMLAFGRRRAVAQTCTWPQETERSMGMTERATNAMSSATDTVKETVDNAAQVTRQQWDTMATQARQQAQMARGQVKSTFYDNPMAMGLAAVAAGALVGLMVPTTQIEGEYMGEARDRLLDQAKSAMQETAQKIQHVAAEAGHMAKEAAEKEGLLQSRGATAG